jgi:hypothetical protein
MTRTTAEDLPDTRHLTPVDATAGMESDTYKDAGTGADAPRAKLLDLSLTQLLGGSMAAATAAALGSRLGVVGTIAGAAVLSIVSAIAASLYTNSMARAKDAMVLVRMRRDGTAVVDQVWWRRPDRATTRRILVTTGAVFAIAAAFLTGLQLATGAQVTGTDLGGRVAAGVLDDSKAGTGGTNESDSTVSKPEQTVSPGETTAPTPAATSATGTPEPGVTTPTDGTGATTNPGVEATTPATGSTPAPSTPTTPAEAPSTTPASADVAG